MKLILSIILMCAFQVSAATYYAATNGNSGNLGTSTNSPWPLDYALQNIPATNTLIVMPGIYSGAQVNFYKSGVNMQSQVKWGARLYSSPTLGVSTHYGETTVDGFEVAYAHDAGIYASASNFVVRNCWVHHCGTNAGTVASGINATKDTAGNENKVWNMLYEMNLVEHNGAADQVNTDHGMYVSGTNVTVRGNVCRYNICAGIQIWDHGQGSTNVQIYNNLCYGNGTYGIVMGSENAGGNTFCNVFGNTLVNYYALGMGSAGNTTLTATNNIVWGLQHTLHEFGGTYAISGDYNVMNEAVNLPQGAHGILTNTIGLVSTNTGLFWLTATSPARGTALTTCFGSVDFFGNAQASVADIGAFQYSPIYALDSRVLDPSTSAGADYWLNTSSVPLPATVGTVNVGSAIFR